MSLKNIAPQPAEQWDQVNKSEDFLDIGGKCTTVLSPPTQSHNHHYCVQRLKQKHSSLSGEPVAQTEALSKTNVPLQDKGRSNKRVVTWNFRRSSWWAIWKQSLWQSAVTWCTLSSCPATFKDQKLISSKLQGMNLGKSCWTRVIKREQWHSGYQI
jgi:hypothetical protein